MTRRIFKLFRPYRGRLFTVLVLIAISAALGMVSPFLLRDILDVAIPENRDELLLALVGGMIGISIVTGVLGVGQTWLTNVVGQRVMHDLRTQVYRHLQRLSLAFFTRTRTGEIQSRIANDIGGVQNVVTTHRGLDRLQRDDRGRVASSRCSCSTGGSRCSRSRCCRSSCCWRAASATSGARSRRSSRARWPTSPRSCRSR